MNNLYYQLSVFGILFILLLVFFNVRNLMKNNYEVVKERNHAIKLDTTKPRPDLGQQNLLLYLSQIAGVICLGVVILMLITIFKIMIASASILFSYLIIGDTSHYINDINIVFLSAGLFPLLLIFFIAIILYTYRKFIQVKP